MPAARQCPLLSLRGIRWGQFPSETWYGTEKKRITLKDLLLFSLYVMSDSLQPHGLQPARLLSPGDCPGKDTQVGCHSLLQRIFWAQGSNLDILYWQVDFFFLNHWATWEALLLITQDVSIKETRINSMLYNQQTTGPRVKTKPQTLND